MTRRLLEYGDDLNDVVRSALDAEKNTPPDPDAARLAKIGAGLAARIGAPTPPPNPQPPSTPPGGGAPVATGGLAAKAPFVLLAAATIAGLAFIMSMDGPQRPSAMPTVVAQPAPIETVAPVAEPAPSQPGISLNDLPSVAPKTVPSAARAPSAQAPTGAPTQEEIALIGRAHDALRSDPQGALALTKEHETKFSNGHFAQEREAVAIEALVYLNRKEEAKRRFDAFERNYPASSHRVHLERLLAR